MGFTTDYLREAGLQMEGEGKVLATLRRLAGHLDRLEIPYAVAGALALSHHGHPRLTVDVDVVLQSTADLEKLGHDVCGKEYSPGKPGTRHLRDRQTRVRIDFLIAGEYPGDRKPKPIALPDPAVAWEPGDDGVHYLTLEKWIEIKLASGMTAKGRLKDLADVQELIKARRLGAEFAERLHPWVQETFRSLVSEPEDET
jgi:hypothetical protein